MFARTCRLGAVLVIIGFACPTVIAADMDADGVPDEMDVCWNTAPGSIVNAVGRPLGDVDEDCDVDLADFAIFAHNLTGPAGCIPEVCDGADNDCDGLIDETFDLLTDLNNCGSCGLVCPSGPHATASCAAGTCGFACAPGYENCDGDPQNGCEAHLVDDVMNCGACGNVCPTYPNGDAACRNSTCEFSCNWIEGWDDCNDDLSDGCEANLSSTDHCGECGYVCNCEHATPVCEEGPMGLRCRCGDCDYGWMNCGYPEEGCWWHVASDPNNCGFCGTPCAPGQTCDMGACCDPGFKNCDGFMLTDCEVNILTDPNNCGACGSPCDPGQTCVNGSCVDP